MLRGARTAIDRFVLARLDAKNIAPSPPADRYTLIRRLSLDLLGLLPTPAEADAFVAEQSPDAYERLVDRLLASPHFGERWGRHWLDQARYADSDGYEVDKPRPDAYRWRDWVIDAVNRDVPFDQFTIEQFAGDLACRTPIAEHATGDGLSPPDADQQRRRRRQGGVSPEGGPRPREQYGHRLAGADARLCPVPRSSVRSLHAARVLFAGRHFQQRGRGGD